MKRAKLRAKQLATPHLAKVQGARGTACGATMHCDCGFTEGMALQNLWCEYVGNISFMAPASGAYTCPSCGAAYYS